MRLGLLPALEAFLSSIPTTKAIPDGTEFHSVSFAALCITPGDIYQFE
jgi:hypothetical protein